MTKYTKLKQNDWRYIKNKARKLFIQELGPRPNFNSVKKDMPNPFEITYLEKAAILVLVVLTISTSIKAGAVGVSFAASQIAELTNPSILATTVFQLVTMVLFALMATPSLIYFKLLDHDPEIMRQKKATQHWPYSKRLSLDYLTPRLPYYIVYASAAWLVIINSHGHGNIFEKYLPVILEVGLAHLVGVIMEKKYAFNKLVWEALALKTQPYDNAVKNYQNDPRYLHILYQVMREYMINLRVGMTRPNSWMETADDDTISKIIHAEYKRLTGSIQNAVQTTKRMPPNGIKWTADELMHDFEIRQLPINMKYTAKDLYRDYEHARSAWSEARKYFHT